MNLTEHPRLLARIAGWVTLVAELSLALWLLVVGVNEAKWRAQANQGDTQ